MEESVPQRAWTDRRLADLLRGRILGGIHTGRLDTGDRLPSYRDVTEETGADLRAIARAYGVLEAEGLVEVRGRSGVFVATQERIGGRVLAETARWVAGVLGQARTRRIRVPDLPEFVRECTASARVRCAFVESTADQIESFCAELRDDYGFEALAVHADRFTPVATGAEILPRIPEEVRTAHIIATTAFHAAEMRLVAQQLGKPLVVVRLNRTFARELQRVAAEEEIAVVCVDPRFVERVRLVAGRVYADRIHGVLAYDPDAVARIDSSRPVLVSQAARAVLRDLKLPPSCPDEPMISPGSADELAELLIRFNLEAMRENGGGGG
ncbi:MAG: GntR family transcriptional regulator [Longimicrobiaceae bacterium]